MSDLHAQAAREIPQMRQDAIDRQRGQLAFEFTGGGAPTPVYTNESPWKPPEGEQD